MKIINNFIQLREFPNYEINKDGKVRNRTTLKILKNRIHKTKYTVYEEVEIRANNKRYTRGVHRLIADTFIRELTKDEHIHHINGNSLDNRIENLSIENKTEHYLFHSSCKSYRIAVFNKDMEKLYEFPSIAEISRQLKIGTSQISRCVNGVFKQSNGYIFKNRINVQRIDGENLKRLRYILIIIER
jgi:hypothetical protein